MPTRGNSARRVRHTCSRLWTLSTLIKLCLTSLCVWLCHLTLVTWVVTYLQGRAHLPEGDNPHNYRYILQPSRDVCGAEYPDLVIGVTSGVDRFKERDAVRQTWANSSLLRHHNTVLLFFLGRPVHSNDRIQTRLAGELHAYDDIVQEDFLDTYLNMSLKSVALLKWASLKCPHSKFVVKADDDVYINVENLLSELFLAQVRYNNFVLGQQLSFSVAGHEEDHIPDTVVTMSYPYLLYPVYVLGPTYAMPGSSARLLYTASLKMPVFRVEDVYINGFLRQKVGIPIIDSKLINGYQGRWYRWPMDGCTFRRVVSGHSYKPQELVDIHRNIQQSGHIDCQPAYSFWSYLFIVVFILVILASCKMFASYILI